MNGLGAFHPNPWRQLTETEELDLLAMIYPHGGRQVALCPSFQNATPQRGNDGSTNYFFSCGGYSFLRQDQPTHVTNGPDYITHRTFVYNHHGPVVFSQKFPEVTPAVNVWRGIPVPYAQRSPLSFRGVPHGVGAMNLMSQMHRGYRSHRRIGALPDTLNAFDSTIGVADGYLAAGEWQNAVVAYQAAGSAAVIDQPDHVAYDIDAATGGASQPATTQAFDINGNLAAVNNTSSATQSDAIAAQGFVRQMQNLYHSALNSAQGGGGGGGGPVQPSQALTSTASALISYLQTNGCSQASISQVVAFQTQYNAEGNQQLTTDGKYGPQTQGALQRVLTASGGGTAPQNCFPAGGGGGSGGGGTVTPGGGGGGTTVTPMQAGVFPWGTAALITSAVVAVGYIAYESKHGKHMLRHAGHHARRLHHGLRHRLLRRRRH